jgi:hypothetical protein
LRRARTAADVLPADIADYLEWASIRGVNPDLSRRVLTEAGRALYVLPGRGAACIVLTGGGGATGPMCASPEELTTDRGSPGVVHTGCDAEGGAGVPRCGAALVFGMVPDGVEDVAVRLSSGTVEAGRVAGNAYLVDVPGDPVRVEYETSAGTVRQVAP